MVGSFLLRRGSQALVWRASSSTRNIKTHRLMTSSTTDSRSHFLNGLNGLSKPASQHESISTKERGSMAPQTTQSSPITCHSAPASPLKRLAVLVDAENASLDSMKLVLREIQEQLGADSIVRRVYGDFSHEYSHKMHLWKQFCVGHAFLPVHAFAYVQGKNSTDTALIIDAMELLFTNQNIDGFCIVSSDSDFTRLTLRLREAGKSVIGFGHQKSTAEPFIAACDKFIFVNDLLQHEQDRLEQEALAKAKALEASRLARERKENERREEYAKAAAQVKAEEEKKAEEIRKSQEGFLQRLISTISNLFRGRTKEHDSIMAVNNDGVKIQSLLPAYRTVPREDLDRLHAKCKKCCDAQGHIRLDLINQGEGSQRKLVDYGEYGYEKLVLLILDHPNEFEIVSDDHSNPPVVKSLKNADIYQDEGGAENVILLTATQLNRLHNVVNSCKDETGWAMLSQVASSSKLQISNLGYSKFSTFVKDMPTEFQFKMRGTASHIKSMRN